MSLINAITLKSIKQAALAMDKADVPEEDRIIYISRQGYELICEDCGIEPDKDILYVYGEQVLPEEKE